MPPAIEAPDEPIAIIGYSCILPGGQNVNESWETIKAGLNCISDLPADRVDVESYFDPNKTSMPHRARTPD
jgi:acyl transferase domain-containing protein